MCPKCSVLVIFEDPSARDRAVQFCDALVQRFWPEFSFELGWCDWADLADPQQAKEADQKAGETELIIVATAPSGGLPSHVRQWLELALRGRADREGALVGLPIPESSLEAATTQLYLRKLAHESGMDFLDAVPQSLHQLIPETLDSYNVRATQVTSVLDRILHQSPPPPRMP
jgi:hypothetical protein